jgi:hypothetical protein
MRLAFRRVVCGLLVSCVLLAPAKSLAQPGLLVGVDDDNAKWLVRPNGLHSVYRDLGVGAVRVSIPWSRGQTKPTKLQQVYLHRVALLIGLGERVVLAVYGRPSQAPTTAQWRGQYCGFLGHITRRLPVRDVVVWNEANSGTFWPTSAGAASYEALLAQCWDTLHSGTSLGARRSINVISSTAAKHDPVAFTLALGEAYRASARTQPIVDTFGHNPYPDNSAEAPWRTHLAGSGTVGQGDLPALLAAYDTAFSGTAQQVPGAGTVSVWYLEDGFQTQIPAALAPLYHGTENDRGVVPAVGVGDSGGLRSGPDQATQLNEALQLAYCQPRVGAIFNFELIDESRLGGWQSGLLWRNGIRKPSYEPFKKTLADIAAGQIACADVPGGGSSVATP